VRKHEDLSLPFPELVLSLMLGSAGPVATSFAATHPNPRWVVANPGVPDTKSTRPELRITTLDSRPLFACGRGRSIHLLISVNPLLKGKCGTDQ
jgi:hypothetical protein